MGRLAVLFCVLVLSCYVTGSGNSTQTSCACRCGEGWEATVTTFAVPDCIACRGECSTTCDEPQGSYCTREGMHWPGVYRPFFKDGTAGNKSLCVLSGNFDVNQDGWVRAITECSRNEFQSLGHADLARQFLNLSSPANGTLMLIFQTMDVGSLVVEQWQEVEGRSKYILFSYDLICGAGSCYVADWETPGAGNIVGIIASGLVALFVIAASLWFVRKRYIHDGPGFWDVWGIHT